MYYGALPHVGDSRFSSEMSADYILFRLRRSCFTTRTAVLVPHLFVSLCSFTRKSHRNSVAVPRYLCGRVCVFLLPLHVVRQTVSINQAVLVASSLAISVSPSRDSRQRSSSSINRTRKFRITSGILSR